MATNIIFDDYVLRTRTALLLGEDTHQRVLDNWLETDPMLAALQGIPLFKGKTSWSHLDPQHWRLLITNTLNKRDATLEKSELFNETHDIVGKLVFLIMGLTHCMQVRSTGAVDTLRIIRVSEIDLTLEFTIMMMSQPKAAPPPHGLQVVVDNT